MENNYNKYIDFLSEKEIRQLLEKDKSSFVGIIPKEIKGKKELMQIYFDKLNLAPYFGGNWDALDEMLHDFTWINAENVIIIHLDIPQIEIADQKILLRVLGTSVKIIREGSREGTQLPTGKHKLQVIFPEFYQEIIEKLGKESTPSQ